MLFVDVTSNVCSHVGLLCKFTVNGLYDYMILLQYHMCVDQDVSCFLTIFVQLELLHGQLTFFISGALQHADVL